MNAPNTTTTKPKYPEIVSETSTVLTVRFTGNVLAIFSPEDKALVMSRNWVPVRLSASRTYFKDSRTGKTIYLHRLLTECPVGLYVDHISRDALDNRRSNLRVLTCSRNNMNRTKSKGKSSVFMGVSYDKRSKRWLARATVQGVVTVIGRFHDQTEAAEARNAFVKTLKDEPFTINVIPTTSSTSN